MAGGAGDTMRDMARTYIALMVAVACAPLQSAEPEQATVVAEPATPNWIWLGPATDDQEVVFRRTFDVSGTPMDAVISGSCDDHMIVLINGPICLSLTARLFSSKRERSKP